MRHFLINRNEELTTANIAEIIKTFKQSNLPIYQKWKDYYDGKQKILTKSYSDKSKPISRVVTNFCKEITNQYAGYLTGQPVKYENDEMQDVLDVLNYNDVVNEDNDYLKNALIFGKAYEVNYIDEEGQQRFKVLDTRECIPLYADDLTGELLYVIRYWAEDSFKDPLQQNYYIEVYGPERVIKYKSSMGFSSFEVLEDYPNYYHQCQVTEFKLNSDEESIFAQIISLQDAYNEVLSSQLDDWSAFVDAYMVLKGVIADSDDITAMKENRVLMIDADADASYLTKENTSEQVQEMLDNYKKQIYQKANCPDYADETFTAESGIAIRYKLISLENNVANIEAQMKKALTRRIELISDILYIKGNEQVWRDIDVIFTRNLPDCLTPSSISELISLKGLVSDETLLSLLPFIKNVDEELEKIKAQNEQQVELYGNGLLEEQGTEE